MNKLGIFFKVEQLPAEGWCENLGDICFTPIRYLWNGRTVHTQDEFPFIELEYRTFDPKDRSCCRTIAAWIFLLPGSILGILFKGVDYCYASSRERYKMFYRHFNPKIEASITLKVGSKQVDHGLNVVLDHLKLQQPGSRIPALVINLTGTVTEKHHQFISDLISNKTLGSISPKKIILVGKFDSKYRYNIEKVYKGLFTVAVMERNDSCQYSTKTRLGGTLEDALAEKTLEGQVQLYFVETSNTASSRRSS